jgi:hypothetical protein
MMTSLLSAVIAEARASRRQEVEVPSADQRAVRANVAAAYCSREAVVITPAHRSGSVSAAARGWCAGGRFAGMAASTSRPSSDGGCRRLRVSSLSAAAHSHLPESWKVSQVTAGMAESGGNSSDIRTIQGAREEPGFSDTRG